MTSQVQAHRVCSDFVFAIAFWVQDFFCVLFLRRLQVDPPPRRTSCTILVTSEMNAGEKMQVAQISFLDHQKIAFSFYDLHFFFTINIFEGFCAFFFASKLLFYQRPNILKLHTPLSVTSFAFLSFFLHNEHTPNEV